MNKDVLNKIKSQFNNTTTSNNYSENSNNVLNQIMSKFTEATPIIVKDNKKLEKAKIELQKAQAERDKAQKKLKGITWKAIGQTALNIPAQAAALVGNAALDVGKFLSQKTGDNLGITSTKAKTLLPQQQKQQYTANEKQTLIPKVQTELAKVYKKPLNLKEKQSGVMDVIDIINRPQQAVYAPTKQLITNIKGQQPLTQDITKSIGEAATGKTSISGGEILRTAGMKDSGKKIGADDIIGLAMDFVLDPTNLIGAGGVSKVKTAVQQAKMAKNVDEVIDTFKKLDIPVLTSKIDDTIKQAPIEKIPTKIEPIKTIKQIKAEQPKSILETAVQKTSEIPETRVLTKIPKEKGINRLEAIKDNFNQYIVNDLHTIDKISKDLDNPLIKNIANNARQSSASAQYNIGEDFMDYLGNVKGKGLQKTFSQVKETELSDFYDYLANKHNIDRLKEGKPVLNLTQDQSIRKVIDYETRFPQFKQYADDVYNYNNNLLDYLKDGGILNDNQIQVMKQMYPNYIPTHRQQIGTSGVSTFGNRIGTKNPIKTATGSYKDILPIQEQMASQTQAIINASKKNNLFKEILNQVRQNPEAMSKYATEVSAEPIQLGDELLQTIDDTLTKTSKGNFLTVYDNGNKISLEISKPLYESLLSLTGKSLSNELTNMPVLKQLGKAVKGFKGLTTAYNPLFTPVNAIRDIQDALLYSDKTSKFIRQYPDAIKEITKNGEMWKKYQALGGFQSSLFAEGKYLSKSVPKKLLDKVFYLNEIVEQAPRFNEFLTVAMKDPNNYDNLMDAMYKASDITVNFGRGGTLTKALDKTFVPFLNAGVQGLDKAVRTFKNVKTYQDILKLTGKLAILGLLPSAVNEMVYGDDKEYNNLQDYIKDNNYLIKVGNTFVKIPKGRVLSAIGMTGQRTIRKAKGEKEAFKDLTKNILSQTAPNNPLTNNIVSAVKSISTNKDWNGNDIVPLRLSKLPPEQQYDEKSTELAKKIGQQFKISPKKIDYVLKQYSGGVGQIGMPLMTKYAEENPIISKFTAEPTHYNKQVNNFYDTIEKLDIATKRKSDIKNTIGLKYLNVKKAELNSLYGEKRKIQASDMKDEDKKKKSKEIQKKINNIAESALVKYKNIEKDKYDNYEVDGVYFKRYFDKETQTFKYRKVKLFTK